MGGEKGDSVSLSSQLARLLQGDRVRVGWGGGGVQSDVGFSFFLPPFFFFFFLSLETR